MVNTDHLCNAINYSLANGGLRSLGHSLNVTSGNYPSNIFSSSCSNYSSTSMYASNIYPQGQPFNSSDYRFGTTVGLVAQGLGAFAGIMAHRQQAKAQEKQMAYQYSMFQKAQAQQQQQQMFSTAMQMLTVMPMLEKFMNQSES